MSKAGVRCQLLAWYSADQDIVVGEGEFCSDDHTYKIGHIQIGPNAAAVIVKTALNPGAHLWRPTITESVLGSAVGMKIPWPADKVILDEDIFSESENKADGEPMETHASDSLNRCRIYDWIEDGIIVAEGVLHTSDPDDLINGITLGPNASIVMVDLVFEHDAFMWRPTKDVMKMGSALNTRIVWPSNKIQLLSQPTTDEILRKPAASVSASYSTSTSSAVKKKCILLDCNNSGKVVAEGRVCSTDPADRVHFIPLGPDASKVWVEVSKIDDAKVWRPNSEVAYISDAVGTTVAWPNAKLKFV